MHHARKTLWQATWTNASKNVGKSGIVSVRWAWCKADLFHRLPAPMPLWQMCDAYGELPIKDIMWSHRLWGVSSENAQSKVFFMETLPIIVFTHIMKITISSSHRLPHILEAFQVLNPDMHFLSLSASSHCPPWHKSLSSSNHYAPRSPEYRLDWHRIEVGALLCYGGNGELPICAT